MEAPRTPTILYCRLPGLLAQAALSGRSDARGQSRLVISEGSLVRDACPMALTQGVTVGSSVVQARRLCPALLSVPLETVNASALRRSFLDILADLSPLVEPAGLDAAYMDLTGFNPASVADNLTARLMTQFNLQAVVGIGVSCLAARACAESGAKLLKDASVDFLWPDDPAVIARLKRLGLNTFGSVEAISEESLRLHFGKIAPLLHYRSHGKDLTPVRALYPPPSAEVVIDCGDAPVEDRERLGLVIARASLRAERQLQGLGVGRKLTLEIRTERGETKQEWAVPAPLEYAADIQRATWRILAQIRLTAPVTRVRLLIEDVAVPSAHTADLFGVRSDSITLEATRRRLAARFGLTTLTILGKQPRTEREKRRAAVRENVEAFQRATG